MFWYPAATCGCEFCSLVRVCMFACIASMFSLVSQEHLTVFFFFSIPLSAFAHQCLYLCLQSSPTFQFYLWHPSYVCAFLYPTVCIPRANAASQLFAIPIPFKLLLHFTCFLFHHVFFATGLPFNILPHYYFSIHPSVVYLITELILQWKQHLNRQVTQTQ